MIYNGLAEASRVSPDWHGWMHHTLDDPPTVTPLKRQKWELPHMPELDRHGAALIGRRDRWRAAALGRRQPPTTKLGSRIETGSVMNFERWGETIWARSSLRWRSVFSCSRRRRQAHSGGSDGYELTARFQRVDGIAVGSDVRVSGVKVGVVRAVALDPETYLARAHV